MGDRGDWIARAIKSFVENPVTNLVQGAVLLWIGLSDASKTLYNDLSQKQLRVGHGLIIIGLFGILNALPQFIEGVEAGKRYHDLRGGGSRPDPGAVDGQGEDQTRIRPINSEPIDCPPGADG